MEGPIFGGAYVRREIIYHFCFVLLCIRGQLPSTSPPGALYSEGRFNEGFFALRFWGLISGGAYTWRGLYSEFYGKSTFRIFFGYKAALSLQLHCIGM